MNWELPNVQAGFRKGTGTRDQTANTRCIIEKAKEFQKNIYFCFIDCAETFDCVDHNKLWKILQEMETTWPASWETCMQDKKQKLQLGMEQQTGTKFRKEYIKAVYCHPAVLTYMQSTSWKMLSWMNHKLELSLLGEISMSSDKQGISEKHLKTPSLWQKVKRN